MRFWVRLVGLLAGVYVVVAGAFSSEKWPSEKTWEVGRPWFWSLVVAGIVVVAAAFVEGVLSRRGRRDSDLNVYCQQIASKIIGHCVLAGLNPELLTVGVWRTKKDNTFDRTAQFLIACRAPALRGRLEEGQGCCWLGLGQRHG
jgi:hypothetical protein